MRFFQCPKSFEYQYIQKVKVPYVEKVELVKGNIVHKLLQYHGLSLPEQIKKVKSDQEISKSGFLTKDILKECIKIYKTFIDTDLGQRILNYKKLAVEISCGLDNKLASIDYKDANLFRGYIDRVCVDTDTNMVYIVDWKSGKDKSEGMFKQPPDQLIYYASWYFETFPVDTIVIMFVFVEHENAYVEYTLTREKLSQYKKLLVSNIHTIEKCEDFVKNETVLCQWCLYLEMCNPTLNLK